MAFILSLLETLLFILCTPLMFALGVVYCFVVSLFDVVAAIRDAFRSILGK